MMNSHKDGVMKPKHLLAYFFITSSTLAATNIAYSQSTAIPCPWIFTGSLGYTQYQHAFDNDGQTALGRLSIGKEFYKTDEMAYGSELSFGLEIGLQTGNSMRAVIPPRGDFLGGLILQTQIKPELDLLLTLRTNTLENFPIFMILKGGIAYRQWQFEELYLINTVSKASPELQAGLGYLINDSAFITLSYQGIYGGTPEYNFNANNFTASIDNIPTQNAILLGLSLTV
jgi:hypothetical protein